MTMQKNAPVFVAGHRGLVGSAICRALIQAGHTNIIRRTRQELNLCDEYAVADFYTKERPSYVFICAAKVGGIYANNTQPATFIYENLQMQNALIHHAWKNGVQKLLFLGSSCIYPRNCPQPIREEYLLSGYLEPTNKPYALAKIAGLEMCTAYKRQYGFNAISVMPTNLYGVGDNYHPENSHVIPALIRRFHEAKCAHRAEVAIWGTGTPRREFLYVDDLAKACMLLMEKHNESEHINVGCGEDVPILELARLVAKVIGYDGNIILDRSKPDGTPQKVLNIEKIQALGWKPSIDLECGLAMAYDDFLKNHA